MTIARKQDRRCSREGQFGVSFMHLELRREFKITHRWEKARAGHGMGL